MRKAVVLVVCYDDADLVMQAYGIMGFFFICNSGLVGIESMGMGSTFVESFWWKDSCGFGYPFCGIFVLVEGFMSQF